MKFEFVSKSLDYLNNDPYRTKVVLGNSEGAFVPIYFDRDAVNKPDAELFELSLEKIYQQNFPGRAENEKFEHFDHAIAEAQKTAADNKEMLRTVSLTLTEFISLLIEAGLIEDPESEVAEDEATNEN